MFLPLFPLVASYASEKAMCLGRCYIGGSDVSSIPRSLRRPQLRLLVPNNVTGTTPVLSASSHIHHVDGWALGSRGQRPTASFHACSPYLSSAMFGRLAREGRHPHVRPAAFHPPGRSQAAGQGRWFTRPVAGCHHPCLNAATTQLPLYTTSVRSQSTS